MPPRKAILLFAVLNAALFAALLPLWEGFDEAFHYAYVESLWQTARLPVLGQTRMPADVSASFTQAPVSHVILRAIPEGTPFDAWFALPAPERASRRAVLDSLLPSAGIADRANYEAHQPPLAYLLLAPFDRLLAGFPLTGRVLLLRLLCGIVAVGLLFAGAVRLCRELELPEPFASTALFCIFCSEMLYATVAHVANDWLAIGVSAMLLAELAGRRSGTRIALWCVAGLLTKAYFLLFVPVVIVVLWRSRSKLATLLLLLAAPWYVRNVALYRNFTGTQEAYDGIGMKQALAAIPHIDWPATIAYLARASLWTGNNSFTSFSRLTLDAVLALLAVGFIAWLTYRRKMQLGEPVLAASMAIFTSGVLYATCVSFAYRGSESAGASPWYMQVLLTPLLLAVFAGLSRWPRYGRPIAAFTVVLWAWVLTATWTFKLFPLYSGSESGSMRIRDIGAWYSHGAWAHAHDLSLTALAPASLLYAALAASLLLTWWLAFHLLRGLKGPI